MVSNSSMHISQEGKKTRGGKNKERKEIAERQKDRGRERERKRERLKTERKSVCPKTEECWS